MALMLPAPPRGRPALRLAVWRVTWGMLRHNPVLAANYTALTTRQTDKLTTGQAHIACAAAVLRWIYALTFTTRPGTRGSPPASSPTTRPPLPR